VKITGMFREGLSFSKTSEDQESIRKKIHIKRRDLGGRSSPGLELEKD